MSLKQHPKQFFDHLLALTLSPWAFLYVVLIVPASLMTAVLLENPYGMIGIPTLSFYPIFAVQLYHKKEKMLAGLTSVWGIWHSILVIVLVRVSGDRMDRLIIGGQEYHFDTLQWILSNRGTIAHPETFSLLHLIGLIRVVFTAVVSFGFTTFFGGVYELNIMNFHVGKLLQSTHSPITIFLFGWPIWSVIRGWGYLLIMFGVAPLFLSFIKWSRPDWKHLGRFLSPGLVIVAVDLILKIVLAPYWRIILLNAVEF
jgi:hypothetical protein